MRIDAAIIGVHKCGTTALLAMLRQHPRISTHATGQWPYFLSEDDYREAFPLVVREYLSDHDATKATLVRDTSLYLHTVALARLVELSPKVKVILAVKHPVERAYSAFCYARSKGFETEGDFGKVVWDQRGGPFLSDRPPICSYVRMGLYYRNLQAILDVLPRERIHVLHSTDLRRAPVDTCNAVFEFLGLPRFDVTSIEANVTRKSRSRRLGAFLRRDTALKRGLKAVLPLHARMRIRRFIARLNATDRKYPPMAADYERSLHALFEDDLRLLRQEFGIEFGGRG